MTKARNEHSLDCGESERGFLHVGIILLEEKGDIK